MVDEQALFEVLQISIAITVLFLWIRSDRTDHASDIEYYRSVIADLGEALNKCYEDRANKE